ncbi:RagB/SusD family nutrient uptake outer membrane protein [Balneolales bacterium ANBcel1]|nr:RagB/SusD family nutrient uptake outer membrane protein [Balneolales bacterium ANBcel1]
MKRLTIVISFLGLLMLSGCVDDFLDHKPPVQRTEDNFFQSKSDAEQALFATYEVLSFSHGRDNTGFHPFDLVSNVLSDDAYGGGSGPGDQPEILEFNDHSISVNNSKALGLWSDRFTGIYRSNLLIENLDNIRFENEHDRVVIGAEARFLRALFYFDLVRLFGNVPLFEEPLVAENIRVSQADPGDVYEFLVTELVDIIPDLRDVVPANQAGRATSWAAQALLGRVYLYHRDYVQPVFGAGSLSVTESEVLAHLEDVISNSGHDLLDDFGAQWGVDGNNNNEAIFSVQHIETSFGDWGFLNGSIGNWASQMTGLRGVGFHAEYASGWSFQPVTTNLVESFDQNADARYFYSILDPVDEGVNHRADEMHQWQGYAFKKFYPRFPDYPSVNTEFNWPYNRPVIRFADVLLMAAELNSPNAQDYFNRVRMRAYGDDFEEIPATRENIMEERRLEFAGEGIRYWDLLRMGLDTAAEKINAQATAEIRINFRTERLGLLPIPQSEINLSDRTLVQNPGYN